MTCPTLNKTGELRTTPPDDTLTIELVKEIYSEVYSSSNMSDQDFETATEGIRALIYFIWELAESEATPSPDSS